jgi:hypothetical protein
MIIYVLSILSLCLSIYLLTINFTDEIISIAR